MQMKSFRVRKFRNVVDSGTIEIDPHVTCLVGKNEAGKSGLIEALYLLNPGYDDCFRSSEQYPRWLVAKARRSGSIDEHCPIQAVFTLTDADLDVIKMELGDVMQSPDITICRSYGNQSCWHIDCDDSRAIHNVSSALVGPNGDAVRNIDALKELVQHSRDNDEVTDKDIAKADALVEAGGTTNRVISLLEDRLPTLFRFTNYSILPGRVSFDDLRNDSNQCDSMRAVRALLALATADIKRFTHDDYESRKSELEAVQIDLTNQVFQYWTQNPSLEVNIDSDHKPNEDRYYLEIRLRDKRTGYSNNFNQRSSGFQWFFSFLAAFSEFEESDRPVLVLLDEPALNLHGRAQADFLRFVNERLATAWPVVYTTHSPFMVESGRLGRVRIVEDNGPPDGAKVSKEIVGCTADSLFPLQAALGYDIAQNLFVGPHNLVVEGISDYIYLNVMSLICDASGRAALDSRWRTIPAGGATNIPTFVSLVGTKLAITVMIDSDAKANARINNMVRRGLIQSRYVIDVATVVEQNEADIEDVFLDQDYIHLYNKAFDTSIDLAELPRRNRIVKQIEDFTGASFSRHRKVAAFLLEHQHEISFSNVTLDRFSKLFTIINDTICNS